MTASIEKAKQALADLDAPECKSPCSGANEYEVEPCRLPAGHPGHMPCSRFKPKLDPGLLRELVVAYDGLELTLLNERGAGTPPSEGWEYFINGPCWSHAQTRSWVRPRPAGCGWRWYRYAEDENGLEAQGEEDTARAAMCAADNNLKETSK